MNDATRHLRRLVVGRSLADRGGGGLESVDQDEAAAVGPGADDVTGRVEDKLSRVPDDEVGDPQDYARALTILLHATRRAASKLDDNPDAPLAPDDEMALEAVIRTDGTRPTLLIRDGQADPGHPLAGDWSDLLAATRQRLAGPVAAIGRIEPAGATARGFFGTGWVVDAAAGLVLTNLHVLEAIWRRVPHLVERTDGELRIHDGVFIDFVRESGNSRRNIFRVVSARPSGVDGEDYARLDVAVLRIEPTGDGETELPAAIPVHADPDGPRGDLASYVVVGFPGPPQYQSGVIDGVDWAWVNATLFGNRYGVKRIAPGTTHQPVGSFNQDPRRWVFGHDATTLGGNSGSPMLNWLDDAPGGFGLHFAVATTRTNIAHAVAACADELRALGVPVRG
jgi:hypothetical protein